MVQELGEVHVVHRRRRVRGILELDVGHSESSVQTTVAKLNHLFRITTTTATTIPGAAGRRRSEVDADDFSKGDKVRME